MDKIDQASNPDSLDSCSKSIEETATENLVTLDRNTEGNPPIAEILNTENIETSSLLDERNSKNDMETDDAVQCHTEMGHVKEKDQEGAKSPEEADDTSEAGSDGVEEEEEVGDKHIDKENSGPGVNKPENIMDRLTDRNIRLPISRVKTIMKTDPDITLVNQDAVFLIAKSAEYFIECLAKEAIKYTVKAKRKTVHRKDIDISIESVDALAFLEGALD